MAEHPLPRAAETDRITLVGLVFEAAAGLRRSLAPEIEGLLGVAGQAFEIVVRLSRTPGHELRMCDLAAQTGLSPSGLTRAVDRLCAAGLVEREMCEDDRRGAFARLTPLGVDRSAAALDAHRREIDALLCSVFAPGEESEFLRLLERLRDRVHPGAVVEHE